MARAPSGLSLEDVTEHETILIVDADAEAPAALARTLEAHGNHVVVARTGADALRAAAEHPVALVLLELRLPDMGGLPLMREIQRRPDPPEVVILTAQATLGSAMEAAEAGTAGYLVKPVDASRLAALARRVLERRRLARENGRLFEQADRERRRLDVLYEVSHRLAAAEDAGQILSLLVNEATRLLDAEAAGIRLVEGDDLVLSARSESAADLMARRRIKIGESLSGRVVATGQPLVVPDLAEDTRFDPAHKQGAITQGFQGFLGVPLRLHDRVIGALNIYTKQRRAFSPDEISLLSALGDQAALAIHKARLLREAEEGRHLVVKLYRVAVSMQDSWQRDDRLRAFIQGAQEAVGFDRIYVLLATPDGDLELVTALDPSEAAPPARLPLSPAAGPFFQVVQTRAALAVLRDEDLATIRPLAPAYRAHPFFRTKRFVIVPLVVGPRVIGVTVADNKRSRRPIPPASVEPLVLLCQQLATALEEARLYTESQTREREATKLYEVTRSLAASLDAERLLDAIATKAVDLLGADASAIYLWDDSRGGLLFRRGLHLDAGPARGVPVRPGAGVAGRAFARRQAVWSRDRLAEETLEGSAAPLAAGTPRAGLAVPIESRGEALGVLAAHFAEPHDWTAKEVQLLSTLADQAAIAIDNARHYEEAHMRQTRLAQILDSTSDGIILVSKNGSVEAVNRRAGEMFGFAPALALGLEFSELMARYRTAIPDYDATWAALSALTDHPDREAQGDFELRPAGRILHWVAQPTHTASGAIVGFTLTFHDVTHEREVSQMKSDFVSFVTHQLRTPLAGIKWMLELAAQEPAVPAEAGSYIQDARDAAQRLITLVNDLLDVSRLEQGRLAVTPRPVRLDEVTRSVLEETAGLARDKDHQVAVFAAADLPGVVTDPQLLRQVILNLVGNAIKYTPPGGEIAIRMGLDDGAARWEIRDSGIGIPRQNQARLFEKFFRADNVGAVETEGTGLGLYLVRLIIERCGGRVWCESEEGKGSTFVFTLPLEDA